MIAANGKATGTAQRSISKGEIVMQAASRTNFRGRCERVNLDDGFATFESDPFEDVREATYPCRPALFARALFD